MNKYLIRGFGLLILGAIITIYSLNLMQAEGSMYKFIMPIGVLCFGIGVILSMYSVFRKIDRNTLQRYRRDQQNLK
ncbi:hypothetical protein [Sphingobacterium corticibacter]|uniref:Uncharacterized protein n=1 Tax=Sphingobacterium corticibacter TaxID=2171749 RepID=A0A2T8HKL0_9SPHI|nr:hypothetical protein [Sphingobacterium corticibacter]PVH25984.1 hypothetical protein DC487_08685 [Sphingobacterium corticibacter]